MIALFLFRAVEGTANHLAVISVLVGVFSVIMTIVNGFMIYIVKDLKESVKSLKADIDKLNERVDKIIEANSEKIDEIKDKQHKNHLELLLLITDIQKNCAVKQVQNN